MSLFERGKKAIMAKAMEGFQSAVSLFSILLIKSTLWIIAFLLYYTSIQMCVKGRLTTRSLLGSGKETTKLGQ